MFMRKRLACSFCGKGAAEVSKLVAGPRVFICDTCAEDAVRIMRDSDPGTSPQPKPAIGIWRRMRAWLGLRKVGLA